MRYIVLRGARRQQVKYVEFAFEGDRICLPDFYLERTPLKEIC
ncbi:MAG: hypothetical protein ACLFVT_03070 [Syntrophobacteria bacterium]